MSFQNPFNSVPVMNTVTLDVDNCEDDFEEFNEDNWNVSTINNQQLWDENWDETDDVDEDLAKFLNINNTSETQNA
ncbi:hypothetical protein DERP_000203 [Dermatophagoides pteronyssinus]|uniref:Uncharacterized protein n=2 Tax=Dermatophagoides pteronyssinus TaxID=6956 RepID=A0ABQ8IZK9_DERPT|nr:uncharacterized protein LOC113788808 [Dermatophagoides pteronyssinus]KAH9415712.1 hypothetical protein DERP_000203 [Dermatophagoides pteronyssinus]